MVKNAVIVPTGAKGGFYAKQLPDPPSTATAGSTRASPATRSSSRGLLDITDNLVGGRGRAARSDVVRHDGDDTYLVVAADKGTATFSDIANGIAADYGFWLDDAFASGGSAGYDHKAHGHHRPRRLGVGQAALPRARASTPRPQDFTVVGVGDMSGDVFGNGMLLSEHIRLVAAFDHRHIFVDPTPDAATLVRRAPAAVRPAALVVGRLRQVADLARAAASSRARRSRSRCRPQMARALGIDGVPTSMTPAELMQAILLAPVDLLWNGGIGTYVKASTETHAEVGDRANDAIRVDGKRAALPRSSARAATSGCTQLGRIEAALGGGAGQHRRHRQLGRRRHLRPRGQHQDPARRGGPPTAT